MSDDETNSSSLKGLFTLGVMNTTTLLKILFYAGLSAIIYSSIIIGKFIAKAYPYTKTVQQADGWYTGVETDNIALGFITAMILCIVSFIVWKVICELLLLIFASLKDNTSKVDQ